MSDETTPQDGKAMSPASTGSVDALAGDREADVALIHDDIIAEASEFIRDDRPGWTLVYRMRAEINRLRLTAAEREAIREAIRGYRFWAEDNVVYDQPEVQAVLYRLNGLLERLK